MLDRPEPSPASHLGPYLERHFARRGNLEAVQARIRAWGLDADRGDLDAVWILGELRVEGMRIMRITDQIARLVNALAVAEVALARGAGLVSPAADPLASVRSPVG